MREFFDALWGAIRGFFKLVFAFLFLVAVVSIFLPIGLDWRLPVLFVVFLVWVFVEWTKKNP